MSTQYTPEHDVHELDYRAVDGVEVALFWVVGTKDLFVVVHDAQSGDVLELAVEHGENGYDVFNHPYAYAAARGLGYERLKELTRGRRLTAADMREFIGSLGLPDDVAARLADLTPASYTGLAGALVAYLDA